MTHTEICGLCKERDGFIHNHATVQVLIAGDLHKHDNLCEQHATIIAGEVARAIENGAKITFTLSSLGE